MSITATQQLGLQPEKLRTVYKNENLPSHDLHIGQDVLYQDATSKQWYLATITSLCAQPRSYNITTRDDVTYRKNMQTLKANCKQFDSVKSKNNQVQSHSRPKRDIKPPVKLDL